MINRRLVSLLILAALLFGLPESCRALVQSQPQSTRTAHAVFTDIVGVGVATDAAVVVDVTDGPGGAEAVIEARGTDRHAHTSDSLSPLAGLLLVPFAAGSHTHRSSLD